MTFSQLQTFLIDELRELVQSRYEKAGVYRDDAPAGQFNDPVIRVEFPSMSEENTRQLDGGAIQETTLQEVRIYCDAVQWSDVPNCTDVTMWLHAQMSDRALRATLDQVGIVVVGYPSQVQNIRVTGTDGKRTPRLYFSFRTRWAVEHAPRNSKSSKKTFNKVEFSGTLQPGDLDIPSTTVP